MLSNAGPNWAGNMLTINLKVLFIVR